MAKVIKNVEGLFKVLRPINLLIVFLSYFFGLHFLKKSPDFEILIMALIAVAVVGIGNLYNDILDFEADKINAPERPIPSGMISMKTAQWYAVLLFVFIAILNTFLFKHIWVYTFNWIVFILTMFYSLYFKKTGLRGNLLVAFFTSAPFLVICIYYRNIMSLKNIIVFAFFLMLIREIVKDLEDIEGDKVLKSKSLPLRFGVKRTKHIVLGLTLLYFVITMFLGIYYNNRIYYFIFIGLLVNVVNLISYYYTHKENYTLASKLLKLNIFIGMIGLWLSK